MEGIKGFRTGGFHTEELEKLREELQAGDTLTYVKLMKVSEDERILVPVKTAVRVKAKYPHIVEVEEPGGLPYPVKTMTYVEILMENTRIKRGRAERKRRRMKKNV